MKKQLAVLLSAGMTLSMCISGVQAKNKSIWALSEKDTRIDGNGGKYIVRYTYDQNGLLIKITETYEDHHVEIFRYKYDKLGYLKERTYKGNDPIGNYRYSRKGRVLTETKGYDKGTKYYFDRQGKILKAGTLEYLYNKKGQQIGLRAEDGSYIKYQYNKKGYLSRYENPEGYVTYTYKYKNNRAIEENYMSTILKTRSKTPTRYKYRKIKVNASYYNMVKIQQNCLTQKGMFDNGVFSQW